MGPLATTSTNGQTALSDLFALSDEQILEIEPEKEMARSESRVGSHEPAAKQPPADRSEDAALTGTATAPSSTSHESLVTSPDAVEPPAWLAAQMKDPWGGEEAREFWDGVQQARSEAAAQHAAPQLGNVSANEAHVAAYAAFERAANEDLERSVGAAIERTLAQALPSFEQHNTPGQTRRGEQAGAQRAAPLQERLASSVRAEVEKALQGDRQLGEQVAQILASRRFDNDARAQIVRLIGERAQQLVPGAAKRVLRTSRRNKVSGDQLPQTQRRTDPGHVISIEGTPSRANKIYKRGTREGVPISTQSGPYYNSYLGKDVKSHTAWLNTYRSEYERKR